MEGETTQETIRLEPAKPVQVPACTLCLKAGQAVAVELIVQRHAADNGDAACGFVKRYKRPVGCTREMEEAALAMALEWNVRVTRVTVMSQKRFSAIYNRMIEYNHVALLDAVRAYGASAWHRQNRAWLDPAKWFQTETVEKWIREAQDQKLAAAKRAMARQPVDAKVAKLAEGVAEQATMKAEQEELLEEFANLAPDEQRELLLQALKEVTEIWPSQGRRSKPTLECHAVRIQLVIILRRRRHGHPAHRDTAGHAAGM